MMDCNWLCEPPRPGDTRILIVANREGPEGEFMRAKLDFEAADKKLRKVLDTSFNFKTYDRDRGKVDMQMMAYRYGLSQPSIPSVSDDLEMMRLAASRDFDAQQGFTAIQRYAWTGVNRPRFPVTITECSR